MKTVRIILTEQRQPNTDAQSRTIIQQAVTAWLEKELSR
mgnify:FL=1